MGMGQNSNCTPEEMLLRVLRVAELILKQGAVPPQLDVAHPDSLPNPKSASQTTPTE
jgi:hypothetical protein